MNATYIEMEEGEEKKIAEDHWVLANAGGISQVRVKTWDVADGDWDERKLETVVMRGGTGNGSTLLLRLPNVRRCPGLGVELSLIEQVLQNNSGVGGDATVPAGIAVKFEVKDLRTEKQQEHRELVRVVCWGKVSNRAQGRIFADKRHRSRRTP